MDQAARIGIIGDLTPSHPSYLGTGEALSHAAGALALRVEWSWLPTESLADPGDEAGLTGYDGLWCGPGSPYRSLDGALRAIRFAREQDRPFLAT
jgi:CTP synthase (UTP-ammonia lyase)